MKRKGDFDVPSFYVLRGFCVCVTTPRRDFICWMITWEKILTHNLIKKGYMLIGWCGMCCSSKEMWSIFFYTVALCLNCGASFFNMGATGKGL